MFVCSLLFLDPFFSNSSYRAFRFPWTPNPYLSVNNNSIDNLPALACYPNPFTSSTTLLINVKEAAYVSLRLTDMQGKKIAHLVDDKRPKGLFTLDLLGSDLNNGIYICTLQIGNDTWSKKIVKK